MAEFFHMGGYAGYVWSAFGITAFVLLANIALTKRRYNELLSQVRQLKKRGT